MLLQSDPIAGGRRLFINWKGIEKMESRKTRFKYSNYKHYVSFREYVSEHHPEFSELQRSLEPIFNIAQDAKGLLVEESERDGAEGLWERLYAPDELEAFFSLGGRALKMIKSPNQSGTEAGNMHPAYLHGRLISLDRLVDSEDIEDDECFYPDDPLLDNVCRIGEEILEDKLDEFVACFSIEQPMRLTLNSESQTIVAHKVYPAWLVRMACLLTQRARKPRHRA